MKETFKKGLFKTLLTSAMVLSVGGQVTAVAQSYEELINNTEMTVNQLSAEQTQLYAQLANSYNQIAGSIFPCSEIREKRIVSGKEGNNDKVLSAGYRMA